MKLPPGKVLAVAVTAVFLAVILAWVWLVRFARTHGDEPIPLPAREQRP